MKDGNRVAVIGLGNYLMSDEGLGVHVVRKLQNEYRFSPQIQLIDGGTTGMDLLPYFETNDRIMIIDAVIFRQQPGYIDIIQNDAILKFITTKTSLHQLGLKDLLSYLKMMDAYPKEIVLVGMQPDIIAVGTELSEVVKNNLPHLLKRIFFILNRWNIHICHRQGDPCA